MKKFAKIMTVLSLLLSQTFGGIFYVNGNTETSGDGTSWENAFKTVEEGISAAVTADAEIWIKAGTYSTVEVTNAYTISNAIKLYGGFAGTETALNQRSNIFSTNKTILTTTTETARILSIIASATIGDVVITGGKIAGPGAGISISTNNITVTIKNCQIVGNTVTQTETGTDVNAGGGGIFINSSFAVVNIENCLIAGNISKHIGGGVCVKSGTANIRNSTIVGNYVNANNWGAGVVKQSGSLNLYNTVVWGNRQSGLGGSTDLITINIRETQSDITLAENCAFEVGYAAAIPNRNVFTNCIWLISNLNFNSTESAPNTAGFITPSQATNATPCDFLTADYNLSTKSILVNSGNSTSNSSVDLNNNPRVWNNENAGISDIGAYERQSSSEVGVVYSGFENPIAINSTLPTAFMVTTDLVNAGRLPVADWDLKYYDNSAFSGEPVELSNTTAMTYYVKAVDKKNNWFAANTTNFTIMGADQSLTIDELTITKPGLSLVTGTVTPKTGFFVDKLTYTNVTPEETLGGNYNFIMPTQEVVIKSSQLNIPENIAFVINDGSGDKNGYNWNHAFASITAAITANKTTIYVANGIYTENLNIPAGTTIYGGFSINEISPESRKKGADYWSFTNATTLTGVITVSGILDGFSILPTEMNTQLTLNGTLQNCYTQKTRINISADSTIVRGCKLTNNARGSNSSDFGGLINKDNSTSNSNLDRAWSSLIENSILSGGSAFLGGAIFYGTTNSAENNAIGKLTLQNCLITNNNTAGNHSAGTKPFGGAVHIHGSLADIINCTIVNNKNTATSNVTDGIGISGAQFGSNAPIPVPKINVVNTVLWNNKNDTTTKKQIAIEVNNSASLTIKHSASNDADFATTYSENNNIQLTDKSPGFTDDVGSDFSLLADSNLIVAGLNQDHLTHDLAGNSRIISGIIDIGAYEHQTERAVGIALDFSVSGHKLDFYIPGETVTFTINNLVNTPVVNYTDKVVVSGEEVEQNADKTFTYEFTENNDEITNFVFTRSTTEIGYLDSSVTISLNFRKNIATNDDETPIFITWGQSNADGSALQNANVENFLEKWYSDNSKNVNKLKMFYSPTATKSANGITWAVPKTGTAVAAKWMNLYYKNDINNNKTAMNINDNYRGMEGSFGMTFYQKFSGNKELYMLKLGISGTPIAAYSAVGDYANYKSGEYSANINWQYWMNNIWKPAIQELLNQGKKPRLAGIWWMQGEREANGTAPYGSMSEDDYKLMLEELVRKTRVEMGFKTADFYIGHICKPGENLPESLIEGVSLSTRSTASTRYHNNVRFAQDQVAAADTNVHIFSETKNAEFESDNLHYSQSGLHYIGATLADKVFTNGAENWASFSNPVTWNNLLQAENDIKAVEVTPYFTPQKTSIYYKLKNASENDYITDVPTSKGDYDVKVNLDYKTWSENKFETLIITTLKITPENILDVLDYASKNEVDTILFEKGDYSSIENIIFNPLKATTFIANEDIITLPKISITNACKLARFYLKDITANASVELHRCSVINGEIISGAMIIAKSTLFWNTPNAATIDQKENCASESFEGNVGSIDAKGNIKLDSNNNAKFGPKLDEMNKPQAGSILINRGGK